MYLNNFLFVVVQAVIVKGHNLEGRHLKVVPASRKKPLEVDKHRLLLTGLPPISTDEEDLLNFIEARTKVNEQPRIQYSNDFDGVALICYSNEIEGMYYT